LALAGDSTMSRFLAINALIFLQIKHKECETQIHKPY